jgi:hypothetical protein
VRDHAIAKVNTVRTTTCVRIGYGAIAQLHEQKLRALGVETLAVIEIDPRKRQAAAAAGLSVASSCEEVAHLAPDFWDVCVPTPHHVGVLDAISRIDPRASVLVEKPVCQYSDIGRLREILATFGGRIVVNENYHRSAVTSAVKLIAKRKLKLRIRRIMVEMTKNREHDFERGRFVDDEFGALGYEGPHMMTILQHLGDEHLPFGDVDVCYGDAHIETPYGTRLLECQGSTHVTYLAASGAHVDFYTSLTGVVKYAFPPFGAPGRVIPREDRTTKYRVLAVEGTDPSGEMHQIVGFYEPISSLHRSVGAVATLKNGRVVDLVAPIDDDTLGSHLRRAVRYFQGKEKNPYDIHMAIQTIMLLQRCAARMTNSGTSLLTQPTSTVGNQVLW